MRPCLFSHSWPSSFLYVEVDPVLKYGLCRLHLGCINAKIGVSTLKALIGEVYPQIMTHRGIREGSNIFVLYLNPNFICKTIKIDVVIFVKGAIQKEHYSNLLIGDPTPCLPKLAFALPHLN